MFTHKRTKLSKYKQIMINNQKIKYSTDAKYLGYYLGFEAHIQETPDIKIGKIKTPDICHKKLHKQSKGA
jgi:hypothetical protein